MFRKIYPPFFGFCLAYLFVQPCLFAQIAWEKLKTPPAIATPSHLTMDGSGGIHLVKNGATFYSPDGGLTWLGLHPDDAIAVDDNFGQIQRALDGNVFLMPDEISSAEIFRYLPASNSWEHVALPNGTNYVEGIASDQQSRLFAGMSPGGFGAFSIYRKNAIDQPFKLICGNPSGLPYQGVAGFDDQHNLLAVGVGADQHQLYHFTAAGVIKPVLGNVRPVVCMGYSTTGTAFYSSYDGVRRSADGGLTWKLIDPDPSQTNFYFDALFFEKNGRIWGRDYGNFYLSEDDGITWTESNAINSSVFNPSFYDDLHDTWFVVNDRHLLKSNDTGGTWTDITKGFEDQEATDIRTDLKGNIYMKDSDGYLITRDGGENWAYFEFPGFWDTHAKMLAVSPDGVLIAERRDGARFRSFDSGKTWNPLTTMTTGTTRFLWQGDDGAFYHIVQPHLYKSVDNGETWKKIVLAYFNYTGDYVVMPNGDVFFFDDNYRYYNAATDFTVLVEWKYNSLPITKLKYMKGSHTGELFFTGTHNGSERQFRRNPDGSIELMLWAVPQIANTIVSNTEGHLFAHYDQVLFVSYDKGNSWAALGGLPFTNNFPSVGFFGIARDGFLYACGDEEPVFRSSAPLGKVNLITGKIWADKNQDCLFDAGETPVPLLRVEAKNTASYFGFTGASGEFSIAAPPGDYLLKVKSPNLLSIPCAPQQFVTLTDQPNTSVAADLPLRILKECAYLKINFSTPFLRRCFDNVYAFRCENNGTIAAPNTTVQVLLDSFFIFKNCTAPLLAQDGRLFTFDLGELQANESRTFHLTVEVSCAADLGQWHCLSARIFPNDLCDSKLPNEGEAEECRPNMGSFDPNDKKVFVKNMENPSHVAPSEGMDFLIRFQNTGTDTAFRVVVEDRISQFLDVSSLQILAASHPFRLELKSENLLRFIFDPIALPDSSTNQLGSNGFIKFRLQQVGYVPLGVKITNEAAIFFDFNTPVITNQTSLIVGTVKTREPNVEYRSWAFPNPFSDEITVELRQATPAGKLRLQILDLLGRVVLTQNFTAPRSSVRTGIEQAGVYFYRIVGEGGRVLSAGKILKN